MLPFVKIVFPATAIIWQKLIVTFCRECRAQTPQLMSVLTAERHFPWGQTWQGMWSVCMEMGTRRSLNHWRAVPVGCSAGITTNLRRTRDLTLKRNLSSAVCAFTSRAGKRMLRDTWRDARDQSITVATAARCSAQRLPWPITWTGIQTVEISETRMSSRMLSKLPSIRCTSCHPLHIIHHVFRTPWCLVLTALSSWTRPCLRSAGGEHGAACAMAAAWSRTVACAGSASQTTQANCVSGEDNDNWKLWLKYIIMMMIIFLCQARLPHPSGSVSAQAGPCLQWEECSADFTREWKWDMHYNERWCYSIVNQCMLIVA